MNSFKFSTEEFETDGMYISASIMTASGPIETKLEVLRNISKDLIHIDYVDDFDLVATLNLFKEQDLACDVHIVSDNPLPVLEQVKSANLLGLPKFVFVQLDKFDSATRDKILSFENVHPAIQIEEEFVQFEPLLARADAVLLMTTTPGKSGGKFSTDVYNWIDLTRKQNGSIKIYIDGGVSSENYETLYSKGVHSVVIGSYLVKAKNYAASFNRLKCKLDLDIKLNSLADSIHHLPRVKDFNLNAVLQEMSRHRSNFVLALDSDGRFEGIITDGDIKRQIMLADPNDVILNMEVKPNFNFRTILHSASVADLFDSELFERRYGAIPLVDDDGDVTCAINLSSIMD